LAKAHEGPKKDRNRHDIIKTFNLWRKICFPRGILAVGKSLPVDYLTFLNGYEWSVIV
jgi:hypothetical protein